MAAGLVASRIVVARAALRRAASPAESVPALAAMVELASAPGALSESGALGAAGVVGPAAAGLAAGPVGPARVRRLLDEAIRYLAVACAALPPGSEERSIALYLLARACRLRDGSTGAVPDLDSAIGYLRQLRAGLPDGAPELAEAGILLADALLNRAVQPPGRAADVDETAGLLTSVLAGLAPDHPWHRPVAAVLATALLVRWVMCAGPAADRDAACGHAIACLENAGRAGGEPEPDEHAVTAHIVLAWTALTRQYPSAHRSAMLRRAEIDAVAFDAEAAARLFAGLGQAHTSLADAQTALDHLSHVPAAPGEGFLQANVPVLRGFAQLSVLQAGGTVSGIGRVCADLHTLAAALPSGHILRSQLLTLLARLLSRRLTQAESSDELGTVLAEVTAVLDEMPRGDPEVARTLTVIGTHLLTASLEDRSMFQREHLVTLFERLAADLAPGDPLVTIAEFMRWSARYAQALMRGEPEPADAALRQLIQRADGVPAGHLARPFALAGVAIAYIERHADRRELRDLQLANEAIDRALDAAEGSEWFAEGTTLRAQLLYVRGHLRMIWTVYEPSLPRVTAAIEDLERAEASLPRVTAAIEDLELAEATAGAQSVIRLGVTGTLETARMLREQLTTPSGPGKPLGPDTDEAFDRLLDAARQAGRYHAEYPVLVMQAAAGLVMRALSSGDVTFVDRAIALLADASTIPALASRERTRVLEMHGNALHTRYSVSREPRDLANAIDRLEDARRAVEQEPGSPEASHVLQALASAYRTRGSEPRGDIDRAVRLGLAGLREHAGDVLLQDSEDNALHVARQGTSDAIEMARWFLSRGRHEAAIGAIELGRAMVLHAATSEAGVAEALRAAGQPALAAEWAGARVPGAADDLRYRAMLALERTPAEAMLLSPPNVGDIAAAVRDRGADALVYLLPQDDSGPGIAVLVTPSISGARGAQGGTVSWHPLPRLRAGPGSEVGEFLSARRALEAAGAPGAPASRAIGDLRQDWLAALSAVCDWAWKAAVGPVLRVIAARGRATARRVVFVPAGELGLVPWHAARLPGGGRYCAQDTVFSYAASARQFTDASRRQARPWPQAPVLISDGGISLYHTAAGIAHLYRAHYAAGTVFGYAHRQLAMLGLRVPGAVKASRDDVLGALPHDGLPGASLLHFGCHGMVSVPVLGSSLRLGASEAGKDMSVSVLDIIRQARTLSGQAAAGPAGPAAPGVPAARGGLVVLASCVSDVTVADYDEALTLAAVFLAAGSAGVVAARWSVPEPETALFMAAFHRFLNGGYPDPADALRQAQLWMLDPARQVPADWPKALRDQAGLAGHPDGPALTGTEAWAGFTYQGQ